MYNERKPRLAVSGWFHGALASEMGDWSEHTLAPTATVTKDEAGSDSAPAGVAASTLEQLKGSAGATTVEGRDDGSPGIFADDFVGTEARYTHMHTTKHTHTAVGNLSYL